MEGNIDNNQPPAAPPAPPAPAAPPIPPAPPAPAAPPAPPAYEQGGNAGEQSWLNSIDWLSVGLMFLSSIALLSVIRYHQVKVRYLKSDMLAANKKIEEHDQLITDLAESKVDKKQSTEKPTVLGL